MTKGSQEITPRSLTMHNLMHSRTTEYWRKFRGAFFSSTPQWIRTTNLRFRRPMLYPIELGVHFCRLTPAGRIMAHCGPCCKKRERSLRGFLSVRFTWAAQVEFDWRNVAHCSSGDQAGVESTQPMTTKKWQKLPAITSKCHNAWK